MCLEKHNNSCARTAEILSKAQNECCPKENPLAFVASNSGNWCHSRSQFAPLFAKSLTTSPYFIRAGASVGNLDVYIPTNIWKAEVQASIVLMLLAFWSGSRHKEGWPGESLEVLIEILNFSSLSVTVISCQKFIYLLAQIFAINFVVTLASICKGTEVNISPGLSYGWARAATVKGSLTWERMYNRRHRPLYSGICLEGNIRWGVDKSILDWCFHQCGRRGRLLKHHKGGQRLDNRLRYCPGNALDHGCGWGWCCCC